MNISHPFMLTQPAMRGSGQVGATRRIVSGPKPTGPPPHRRYPPDRQRTNASAKPSQPLTPTV